MELRTFVCVFGLFANLFVPSHQVRSCGGGNTNWEIWQGNCYSFVYMWSTFDQANKDCTDLNANLVSIHSEAERDYVHKRVSQVTYGNYWIGMRKDTDSTGDLRSRYYWIDGTPVDYDNWAPGEPNGHDNWENHVEVYYNGLLEKQWNDITGTYYRYGRACKTPLLEGWQEYNGNEYYISYEAENVEMSWHTARAWCMENGGDLASITSLNEADQIAKWAGINNFQGGLWIGLNKLDGNRQKWGWSDKAGYSVELWKDDYPKDHYLSHLCGYQDSKDKYGKWMNGHCNDKNKGFVCKRPKGSTQPRTDPPTVAAGGYCPQGFMANGNKCFKVVVLDNNEGVTFNEATDRCRREAGILPDIASVTSALDQAFITSQLQDITFGVWIGMYRPSRGDEWRWVDSSSAEYTNWAPDEPQDSEVKPGLHYCDLDTAATKNHCAQAWVVPGPIGTWKTIHCDNKRGYVCQTFKDSSNPINTPPSTTTHTCPSGFTPYWYGCFRYQEKLMGWQEAQDECRKLSPQANLVGIHAEPENAAVQAITLSKNTEIWTGFRDKALNGEYIWQDGWATFYTNWAPGQPRRQNADSGCVKMFTDGTWSDDLCILLLPSVCKISQVDAMTTPATRPGRCPSRHDWEEYDEHCYLFMPRDYVGWEQAKSKCGSYGALGNLASIHSDRENKWISDRVDSLSGGRRSVWIGLYRSKQDQDFRWSDLSGLQYEAWAPGEPNGEERQENCVELYNQYWPERWNDHYCNDQKGYVCKAPKVPHVSLPTNPSVCGAGWIHYKKACYLFKPDVNYMYDQAQAECKTYGENANLASVHDWEENLFIEEAMYWGTDTPIHNDYWIGMTKTTANEPYLWDDGSEVDFEHWAPGEPNSADNDNENCVEIYVNTGRWNDIFCTRLRGMVCKIDIVDDGLSGGAIAGIVIGVLVGAAVLIVIIMAVLISNKIINNPVNTANVPNPLGSFKIPNPFTAKTASPGLESDLKYERTP